jgi:hypothetical protein
MSDLLTASVGATAAAIFTACSAGIVCQYASDRRDGIAHAWHFALEHTVAWLLWTLTALEGAAGAAVAWVVTVRPSRKPGRHRRAVTA